MGCHNCNNCYQQELPCQVVVASPDSSVDVSYDASTCTYNLAIPCIPTVESSDGSIDVIYNTETCTYDISSPCCDFEDKLVATNAGCTPDYLINNIEADTSGVITISEIDCKVVVGFNASALPDNDEKVAVSAECTPVYLENAMTDGVGTTAERVGCNMATNINPEWDGRKRPWAWVRLTETWEQTGIPQGSFPAYEQLAGSVWDTDYSLYGASASGHTITLGKAGMWFIQWKGITENNDSISAIRVVLGSSATSLEGLLDQKYGSRSPQGQITDPVLNLYPTADSVYGWGQGAIVNVTQAMVDGGGVEIFPIFRVSLQANTDVVSTSGHFRVVGDNGTNNTPLTPRGGFQLSAHYIGDTAQV